MSQKRTWPVIVSIILALLFEVVWIIGIITAANAGETETLVICVLFAIYGLIYWLPTFIHSSPKVFLINLANFICCFAWIGALVVAIMDKKNPNGTSMPAWNQNPTWDNSNGNAQNYWGNDQNNQWGNQPVQGQQPAQPNSWETPNQNIQPDVNQQNGQSGWGENNNPNNSNQNGGW